MEQKILKFFIQLNTCFKCSICNKSFKKSKLMWRNSPTLLYHLKQEHGITLGNVRSSQSIFSSTQQKDNKAQSSFSTSQSLDLNCLNEVIDVDTLVTSTSEQELIQQQIDNDKALDFNCLNEVIDVDVTVTSTSEQEIKQPQTNIDKCLDLNSNEVIHVDASDTSTRAKEIKLTQINNDSYNVNKLEIGVMGGPMSNANAMVGMGNQMVPPYGPPMQNQMGNMNLGPQGMGVGVGGPPGGLVSQAIPQQGMATPAAVSVPPAPPAQPPAAPPPQNKEFNTASLCKFGQETVQDIVSRTQDVFQTLKAIQPPNGTPQGVNASNEKKAKMQEQLRTIRLLFKRLRLIYEKCNETCQGMEYTHMESLIPLKDEADNKTLDERRNTEAYRLALEENRELTDQVVLKNKHLKDVITNLRSIIWEINVMLTMRRS